MLDYPVRAGVFPKAYQAIDLVNQLVDAGFTWDEISVICSEETRKQLFPEEVQQSTSSQHATTAMNAAGAGLLGLGGLATAAAILSGGGAAAVMIMGAFAGVAAGGTFTALMATRGFESEASDYFDQAVQEGKILVAVEAKGDDETVRNRLAQAERLIEEAGAESVPLAR